MNPETRFRLRLLRRLLNFITASESSILWEPARIVEFGPGNAQAAAQRLE